MKTLLSFLLLLMLCSACSEFLSPDVSGVSLRINGPADSLHSSREDIAFWWEPEPLAEHYRFQVVSPDFQRPLLLLDTLLTDNSLAFEFNEGVFSWRLQLENAASSSRYATRQLVIDRSSPIPPLALAPGNGDTLSFTQSELLLQWHSSDQALDGFVFPVSDSLYLYKMERAQLLLRYVSWTEEKRLDIRPFLEEPDKENPLLYCWVVKSIDRAGNVQRSPEFTFVLVP